MLRSAGMLHIRATQDGRLLKIDQLELPSFFLPSDQFLARAQMFDGVPSGKDSLIDWRSPSTISLNRIPFGDLGICSNILCDGNTDECKFFFCKINRFFGFEKAPTDAFSAQLEEQDQERDIYCEDLNRLLRYYGTEDISALIRELEVPLYSANAASNHEELMQVFQTKLAENIKARHLEKDINFRELQYYAFQRSQWGWANVDAFYEVANEDRVNMTVDLIVAKDRDVKLFLPERNIMLTADNDGDRYEFRGVPKGEAAVIIALEYRNGNAAMGMRELTVQSGSTPILLEKMSVDEMKAAIEEMGLQP